MSTVLSSLTAAVLEAVSSSAEEKAAIVGAAGIEPKVLTDPEGRVTFEQHSAMWKEAVRLTGNSYLGLKVAGLVVSKRIGVVVQEILRCDTLGQALDRFMRYQRLLHDAVDISLVVTGAEARVCMSSKFAPVSMPRPQVEFGLGTTWLTIGQILGEEVFPLETRFRHEEPPGREEYYPIFGDALSFGALSNDLVFPAELLDRPNAEADPEARARLEEKNSEMLESLPAADSFIDDVRRAVFDQIGAEAMSSQLVARVLSISPTDLKRELTSRGTSFRVLVNGMKRDLAIIYLEDQSWPLADIAFVLGFRETAIFNRTFKGWTGETPGEYRRAFLGG